MDPTYFATAAEFRAWLEANHATAKELLVGYYKVGSGRPSITWPESVDQALCFGWIDGIRRRIDETAYTIRFTPRKRTSIWSAVNIKRVELLTTLGLIHPAGIAAFDARDAERSAIYGYEREQAALDPAYEARFRTNDRAWAYFESRPPSYRKPAIWWVMSAKREETRLKRLETLIADSEAGRTIAPLTPPSGQRDLGSGKTIRR